MIVHNQALGLIQIYWIVWLVGSFVVAIILGGIIFRNYESVRQYGIGK